MPQRPEGGLRRLKDRLLNLLIILLVLIIVFSLGVIFIFYNPSIVTGHFAGKRTPSHSVGAPEKTGEGIKPPSPGVSASTGEIPSDVEERVRELAQVLTDYVVYLRGGLKERPALVFKAEPDKRGVRLYLLTYYPMEWPFVKVELNGYGTFTPERVYLCRGGLVIVELSVKGLFPPEVSRGRVEDYGALLTFSGGKPETLAFGSGKCDRNGFVFDLAGEFAGVCFGGEFIDAGELYSEVPQACKIIYEKEEENGDLQGQDRQLVR